MKKIGRVRNRLTFIHFADKKNQLTDFGRNEEITTNNKLNETKKINN